MIKIHLIDTYQLIAFPELVVDTMQNQHILWLYDNPYMLKIVLVNI